jgi:hypothetical protein
MVLESDFFSLGVFLRAVTEEVELCVRGVLGGTLPAVRVHIVPDLGSGSVSQS